MQVSVFTALLLYFYTSLRLYGKPLKGKNIIKNLSC